MAGWRTSRDGVEPALDDGRPVARLSAAAGRPVPTVSRLLAPPDGLDALRFSLDVRASRLVPGDEPWQVGRVQVWTFDRNGRFLWYWPKEVASLSGDMGWRPVAATIPLGAEVAAAYFVVYNGALSGDMAVRGIRVAGLEERAVFRIARALLLGAWVVAAAWGAAVMVRAGGWRRYALLAAACATLAGVLVPQPLFRTLVAPIEAAASGLIAGRVPGAEAPRDAARTAGSQPASQSASPGAGTNGAASTFGLKTVGHFAAFTLLTVLAALAYPGATPITSAAYVALLATASESLQQFLITRSSQGLDLAADIAGIILAAVAVAFVRRLLRSRPAPR